MMKKLLLVLMIATLMAGMSLPALAEEITYANVAYPYCKDPTKIEFPVEVTIKEWAKVEFDGELNFGEVGFCDMGDYKLYWINSDQFMTNSLGGASQAYLPNGESWASLKNKGDVHVNDTPGAHVEVNPRMRITTNANINVKLAFEDDNWEELSTVPFYVPIWSVDQNKYVGAFGRNVYSDSNNTVLFPDTAVIEVEPCTQVTYHLDGGILFEQGTFWKYEVGTYTTAIVATVTGAESAEQ